MIIPVKTQNGSYNIYLERGALAKAGTYFELNRKVLVVTDSGVPAEYADAELAAVPDAENKNIKKGIELGEISKLLGATF